MAASKYPNDYPKMTVKFEMSLWQRIRAASLVWWNIVVTSEIECIDDENESRE